MLFNSTLIYSQINLNQFSIRSISRDYRYQEYKSKYAQFIYSNNYDYYLSKSDIVELRDLNFQYSEMYNIDPWIFLAFCAVESSFNRYAENPISHARGLVQFMPSTLEWLMGKYYYKYAEFSIYNSVRYWYEYFSSLVLRCNLHIDWAIVAYLSPSAVQYKNNGHSIEEFMNWIHSFSYNKKTYLEEINLIISKYGGIK